MRRTLRKPRDGSWGDDAIIDLVTKAAHPQAQAVLLPETALHTDHLASTLEDVVGVPVLTATQATVWSLYRSVDTMPSAAGAGPYLSVRALIWPCRCPGVPQDIGDSSERASQWRERWRNIHDGENPRIEVTLAEENVGPTVLTVEWRPDSELDDMTTAVRRKGERSKGAPRASAGHSRWRPTGRY